MKISLNLGSNRLKHKQQLFGFLETFWQLFAILKCNFAAFYEHNRDRPKGYLVFDRRIFTSFC